MTIARPYIHPNRTQQGGTTQMDDPRWRARLHPHYLPSTVLLVLELVLLLGAFTRGLDYLSGVSKELAVLPIITELLDVHTWGVLFLAGAVVLGLGITLWNHLVTWSGHVFLAVVHAGFFLGAAKVTVPAGEYRIPAALLLPLVLHALLARHLGPVPARRP